MKAKFRLLGTYTWLKPKDKEDEKFEGEIEDEEEIRRLEEEVRLEEDKEEDVEGED